MAAQPLLTLLKVERGSAAIDVLASPWVAAVLERMPEVRRIIDNPFRHGELDMAGRWRLGRELAASRYDEAIVLPNSWKSALIPFFARIPKRTGYSGEARIGLINNRHRLVERGTPQIAQRYARLADHRNAPLRNELPLPRLTIDPEAVRRTLGALEVDRDDAPLALCPGAEYGPAKQWPAEHFAQLARRMAERGHSIWLIGSPKDRDMAAAIAELAPPARNLCGRTTLRQAIDLLAAARLVVTNDSGLMHVAAALDRPMVALFGSSSPRYTPPLSPKARVLWLELECSPCFRRECPLGHFRCMRELSADHVVAAIDESFSGAELPATARAET